MDSSAFACRHQGQSARKPSLLVAGHTPDAHDEHPVNVVETRVVDGGLWLRIATLDESPCNGGAPGVIDRGWIPAYATSGALVAGRVARRLP